MQRYQAQIHWTKPAKQNFRGPWVLGWDCWPRGYEKTNRRIMLITWEGKGFDWLT